MRIEACDYLVAGSGIAGLMSALNLAPHGRVLLTTKKESAESNTNYAQGGIACVMEPGDSFEQHVADTLDAGAGLCDEAVVRRIVTNAPARIAELEKLGVRFAARDNGQAGYDLGRELEKVPSLAVADVTVARLATRKFSSFAWATVQRIVFADSLCASGV